MASQQDKKPYKQKPRFEQKSSKIVRKFQFVFDEQKISYKTQIPEMPTKLKPKPNQQHHNKAVDQLNQKISELKEERKKKKDAMKKGSQNFDKQIASCKNHIQLGNKCLTVLAYDQQSINQSLTEVSQKLQRKSKYLKNLLRGPRQNKQQKKKYEQMTYQELEAEQDRIRVRVSTANINKKQQTQLNNLLAKLARFKANAKHGQTPKDNTFEIEKTQSSVDRLKIVKQSLQAQLEQIKNKIQAIEEDIQEFKDQIDQLQEQKKNPQNQEIQQQCKLLKDQIYKLREELSKLNQQYQGKKLEYERQQAKIEWIKWATEIRTKQNEQWEAEKQQRRKQKLKQKNKQKAGQTTPQNEDGTQQKPQRKRPNKYQKQIDSCVFLIQYCQGLVKKQQNKEEPKATVQQNKNIQALIKSNQWSKGVALVKSKKSNLDDQDKNQKIKKKKTQKKQTQSNTQNKGFTHQFFTQHAFDQVKVIPPTKAEEVDGIIKQLNEKLAYYMQHPQGTADQNRYETKKESEIQKPRQKYVQQKYTKGKYQQRQKKAINTQQFPSLQ